MDLEDTLGWCDEWPHPRLLPRPASRTALLLSSAFIREVFDCSSGLCSYRGLQTARSYGALEVSLWQFDFIFRFLAELQFFPGSAFDFFAFFSIFQGLLKCQFNKDRDHLKSGSP